MDELEDGRILLIDPQPAAARATQRYLRVLGHRVLEVIAATDGGAETRAAIAHHAPELVLINAASIGLARAQALAELLRSELDVMTVLQHARTRLPRLPDRARDPREWLAAVQLTLSATRLAEAQRHTLVELQATRRARAAIAAGAKRLHELNNLLSAIRCNAFLLQQESCATPERLEVSRDIALSVERGASLTSEIRALLADGHGVGALKKPRVRAEGDSRDTQEPRVGLAAPPADRAGTADVPAAAGGETATREGVAAPRADRVTTPHPRMSGGVAGPDAQQATQSSAVSRRHMLLGPPRVARTPDIPTAQPGATARCEAAAEGINPSGSAPPSPAAESVLPTAVEPSTAPGRRHVLVVDDERVVQRAMARFLSARGYQIHVASGPAEARIIFEREPIQLLITDLAMAGGSGYELATELKARRPGIHIIYMSGYAADTHAGDTSPAGALLHKPFAPETLLTALSNATSHES